MTIIMVEGIFDIVFAGRVVPTKSVEEVKAGLAKLFKTNAEQIERLFSAEEVTIKKGLDYAQAMKYQSALKQVGALVLIKKQESSTSASKLTAAKEQARTDASQHGQVSTQGSSKAPLTKKSTEPSDTVGEPRGSDSEHSDAGEWGVAAAGELLPEQEKAVPIPEPDLSGLSLGGVGEPLAKITEKPSANIDTSSLSLSEPAPLPQSKTVPPRDVDISALSMAAAGKKIPTQKREQKPVNPNIDHLEISK